jgi:hypothetical protein
MLFYLPQKVKVHDLKAEGWGFVRDVGSEWHVPRGDDEAMVTQPD